MWILGAMLVGVGAAHADGMHKNGLSRWAFRENAISVNPAAMDVLASHFLNNDVFAATGTVHNSDGTTTPYANYLAWQLRDESSRAVFTDIVRCALGANRHLSFIDPYDHTTQRTFDGEMGLCDSSTTTSWFSHTPDPSCKQTVSACVISRVNAIYKSVPVSFRSQGSAVPTQMVDEETTYREGPTSSDPMVGYPIHSFDPSCLAGQNCGWKPAKTGTCSGFLTTVKIKSNDPNKCPPIRVCDSLEGCLGSNSGFTVPSDVTEAATTLASTSNSCTALPFNCPPTGVFSVMAKTSGTLPNFVVTNGNGDYPKTEAEVYSIREGAFFGDLFATSDLGWNCTITPGTSATGADCVQLTGDYELDQFPYQHIYGCYSGNMVVDGDASSGPGYVNARLCDYPDQDCFPHTPGRCWASNFTNPRCQWDGNTFHDCKGDGPDAATTFIPMTTYLHGTCDLVTRGDGKGVCAKIKPPALAGGTPDVGEGPDTASASFDAQPASGGCAATTSSTWLVGLGVAFVALRRRRRIAS